MTADLFTEASMHNGVRVYGYRFAEYGTYEADRTKAEVVREVFAMRTDWLAKATAENEVALISDEAVLDVEEVAQFLSVGGGLPGQGAARSLRVVTRAVHAPL